MNSIDKQEPSLMKHASKEHSIDIFAATGRVSVRFAGQCIADSHEALELRESGYPPVLYIPRKDLRDGTLRQSSHQSYCPFKGEARYLSLEVLGRHSENALWFYPDPFPEVAALRNHVAFYPDRVDEIVHEPAPREAGPGSRTPQP